MSTPWRLLRNPLHFLALGCGSGLLPRAPGTAGTLAAIPPYLLLRDLPLPLYLLFLAGAFLFGVYLCAYTARRLQLRDPQAVVWDEWVGFWCTMIAVPPRWEWLLLGLVLFRILDIAKPWPIRSLERLGPPGVAIMLDDLGAAAIAWLLLQTCIYVSAFG